MNFKCVLLQSLSVPGTLNTLVPLLSEPYKDGEKLRRERGCRGGEHVCDRTQNYGYRYENRYVILTSRHFMTICLHTFFKKLILCFYF